MASAKEIPPGGEGKIAVTFKTGKKSGKRSQPVTVYTDDPVQPTVRLKVVVDIQVALATKPGRIYFGRMKKGAPSSSKYVSLIGTDKDITKITSVVSNNKYIKVEEEPPDAVGENKDKKIKITVLPGMKVGTFREKIVVNTDHNKMKQLLIHIQGNIVGNITVIPPYLYFGIFKKGETYARTIRLKAAPGVSFKVLDVRSTTPDLIANLETL
ncbi:MAG: DUF1573 domain-containing protein, partial [Deltaproteobacteria bacterium]|nr:DUF1573 domain-containing protein [Deltaproteobacteria bacterium]